MQRYYSWVFAISSVIAPMFLGFVAGVILLAQAPLELTNLQETFVCPWLNLFCLSLGLFTTTLFTFLAAVYPIGETSEPELRSIFVRRAGRKPRFRSSGSADDLDSVRVVQASVSCACLGSNFEWSRIADLATDSGAARNTDAVALCSSRR